MKFLTAFLCALPLLAHVGSPDVFYEGAAGPYRLLVTVRPPQVIPGVAEVEVRSASPDLRGLTVVPLRLTSEGSQYAPVPDVARRSKEDPQFYTASIWLMASGSWQLRLQAEGTRGAGVMAVPVPAISARVLSMQRNVALALLPLGILLCVGLVSIAGAAAREASLAPGEEPGASRRRQARLAMGCTLALVMGLLWLGNSWWSSEAGGYSRYVFKPLELQTRVDGSGLLLSLKDPGWLNRRTDDLVPDHNHLMHLYVFHVPQMDLVWHLHPEQTGDSDFAQSLPAMPAGRYALFADVVHSDGMAETATAELETGAVPGRPLTGDDAAGAAIPIEAADYSRTVSTLPDGYRIIWARDRAPLHARQPREFRFILQDPQGRPADNMELYMGMPGHAAFVRSDRSVFAHIHPAGSVSMAAMALTGLADPHAAHRMIQAAPPAEVSFPYGFPKPGAYRIFVQMKRAGVVETGIFDAKVEN